MAVETKYHGGCEDGASNLQLLFAVVLTVFDEHTLRRCGPRVRYLLLPVAYHHHPRQQRRGSLMMGGWEDVTGTRPTPLPSLFLVPPFTSPSRGDPLRCER